MKKFLLLLVPCCLALSALGQVSAKKTSGLHFDGDGNSRTNPGDTLRYTITITNTSSTNLLNVQFTDSAFPNQTLVGGSIKTTPVARPDTYSGAIGNTFFSVPAASGVLTNDSDPDGDPVSVVSFAATSANGGAVNVTNNGGFTYLSAAGFTGTDTFTYEISDGNGGTNTGTATIIVSNRVWYVNNAGVNGDGRQNSPFNSLTPLNNSPSDVDGPNDYIYLFQGSANYATALQLESGQRLIGSGAALVVGVTTIFPAGTRPAIVISTPGAIALTLASNNLVQGLNIRSLNLGQTIAGTNVGTLTITNLIAVGVGGATINLNTGTATVTLDDLFATNGPGIRLNAINGSFVAGGVITGTAGTAVQIAGGNGTVSYAGIITNTSGRSVDISGRTGGAVTLSGNITDNAQGIIVQNNTGGTVTFSGAAKRLTTGANTAVVLTSNTGATINFTNGGLVIAATSGGGLNVTGGGTVTVTTGAITNAITTTTGVALNVQNTTIGASGLTFRSISANGASSGIVLANTGANAGLTVTGSGNTAPGGDHSGGTIQNTTAIGISLTGTINPSFTNLNVQNTGRSGIKGSSVSNFVFTCSKVGNSGTALVPGSQDANIAFNDQLGTENNLSGNVTITRNTLTNAHYHGISIFNFSGTISNLNISTNTLASSTNVASSLGSGIQVVAFGSGSGAASIVRATLDNNVINNFPSAVGLQVQCGNANSISAPPCSCGTPGTTNVVAVTRNKINAPGLGSTVKTGNEGMIVLVNGAGQGNFNISSNSIQQNLGTALSHSAFGSANVTSVIYSNVIVANNINAAQGIGVGTSITGGFATNGAHLTTLIGTNTVSQTDGNGILAVARDNGNGKLDVAIKGNNVAAPLTGVRQGIRIDAGNSTGDNDVCLDISGNTSAPSVGQPAALGIGLRKQGTSTTINAFGIEGMAATATPGVEAFVNGQNPSGGGTLLISATSGFSNCSSAP